MAGPTFGCPVTGNGRRATASSGSPLAGSYAEAAGSSPKVGGITAANAAIARLGWESSAGSTGCEPSVMLAKRAITSRSRVELIRIYANCRRRACSRFRGENRLRAGFLHRSPDGILVTSEIRIYCIETAQAAGGGSALASGKLTWLVVPWPASLLRRNSPPICTTSRWTRIRPNPRSCCARTCPSRR